MIYISLTIHTTQICHFLRPRAIPGGATLHFDVEVVDISNKGSPEPNLFAELDVNGDKQLSKEEVLDLFIKGGTYELPPGLWEEADKDGVRSLLKLLRTARGVDAFAVLMPLTLLPPPPPSLFLNLKDGFIQWAEFGGTKGSAEDAEDAEDEGEADADGDDEL
jgi:hypothetical protein